MITTVSFEEGQLKLLIVQTNVLEPTLKFVVPDVGSLGVVTLPDPVSTVHAPAPTVGVLPANVVVVEHTV